MAIAGGRGDIGERRNACHLWVSSRNIGLGKPFWGTLYFSVSSTIFGPCAVRWIERECRVASAAALTNQFQWIFLDLHWNFRDGPTKRRSCTESINPRPVNGCGEWSEMWMPLNLERNESGTLLKCEDGASRLIILKWIKVVTVES